LLKQRGDRVGSDAASRKAFAAFREAVRLRPDLAVAHKNLGNALSDLGKHDEAIAEYREAIRLKPDFAEAHCDLGGVLQQQGQFREALAGYRRGHELGSRRPGWPYPSAEWVRQAERMVVLESRLPAVIRGGDKPLDAAEGIAFAELAYKTRQFGPSARLYAESFRAGPKLAEDMEAQNRYHAARAAALAAAGKGEDEPPLDENEKARWGKQACDWLKADLAHWAKQAEAGPPHARSVVSQTLQHWKADPDLAGIREQPALAELPEDERKACRTLWADVEVLLEKVRTDSTP
jgi:tetratricopeptide (TPR) repeat protein